MTSPRRIRAMALFLAATLPAAACAPAHHELVLSPKPVAELRAMQSMTFEGTDQKTLLRATIAALLDLGYAIDSLDAASGAVSASKGDFDLTLSAVVERGSTGAVLRCDANVNLGVKSQQVDSPEFYQQDVFQPVAQALRVATGRA
jgi:hypothetical protein